MQILSAAFWSIPDPMQWAIGVWLFAFGACAGSFMNVVIWRLPLGRSVVYPGSRCPNCGHSVRSYDNIPILNWLVLRGRCRDCGARISWRYPAVETLVATLFVCVAVIEPLRAGQNLPRFPEASLYYWPGLISLWVLYATQMLLLCTLLCAAFMWFDGHRPPARLFVPATVAAGIVPLVWPTLRPEQWIDGPAPWFSRREVATESLASLALAILVAMIVAPLFASRNGTSRWRAAMCELVACAFLFGAVAFVRITLMAVVMTTIAFAVVRVRPLRSILPWSAAMVISIVLQLALWKQSATWTERLTAGRTSFAVVAVLLTTACLAGIASLMKRHLPDQVPGWNQDWPIQPKESDHGDSEQTVPDEF